MPQHSRPTATITRRLLAPLVLVPALVAALLPALSAQAVTTIAKINFQPATFTTPTGYTPDNGLAYSSTRGFGWIDEADSNPMDMTANMRSGNSIAPAYARVSDVMMQPKAAPSGRWEYAIPNGTYNVTLTVGDARNATSTTYCCLDGTFRVSVEGVRVINDYVASPAAPLYTNSANIAVSDGKLTLDAAGGVNTKLDHVEITTATGPAQGAGPVITGVTPAAGATGVALNTAVSLAISAPVDLSTVTSANVRLTSSSGQVAGNYNADAAGGTVSFTPSANLAVTTVYTVTVTSGLKGADGQAFAPFTSTFTTGSAPPPLATTAFSKLASVPMQKPSVLAIGPDGKLYAGSDGGQITRFTRAADGSLSSPEVISPFGNRVITGLAFDPVSPTKLWVTSGYAGYTNAPPMSGHISTITIAPGQALSADVASAANVIVGLPRSMHDHMTNGLAFGPDGKLYIAQGANTAYGGAPDPYWGARGEAPLSSSILMADVDNASVFPPGTVLDVNTDPVGTTEATGSDSPVGYNPGAANAAVKVFAYGTRNPFTLLWDSNGRLYAPVNESAAGGITPAGPGNVPVSVSNVQAYTDYFTRVQAGKYYGHPNPAQGYYALNGGNPTAAGDPYEVTEYPVGTQPDPNWQAPDFAMGAHRSPDGAAEYTNTTAFSGALQGKILVSEYSDGDDVMAFTLDASGKPVSEAALPDADNPGQALIFNNPLGLAVDKTSGVVYVAEHDDETVGTAGDIAVLTPAANGTTNNGVHVNFQPGSVAAPTGYAADTGAAFNGQTGWQDFSGAPIDLSANTRVAHAASSPDVRYDTDLLMQAPAGSGNTTPGQWATTLPNGSYDVTVGVGDPLAFNSTDEIIAQPGTADAVTIIDHFVPSAATPWQTMTKRVKVTNGALVLSPAGGTNTKIDFVDAVLATTDGLAPTVTVSLAGPLTSGTTYSGPVTFTASAVDNVGVTSITYVLDGAAAKSYTAPVVVSATGTHTVTVTAKDAAGNPGVATKSFAITSSSPPGGLHVNFAAQTSAAVAGYTTDFGAAFSAATGAGWEDQTTGAPVSAIGNGRERNSSLSPDKRYDTFVQMQETAASTTGTHTPVRWEHALANGTYLVTVAVGDPTATNSVDTITAEPGTANSTVIINSFQATSTVLFQTMTKTVTVSDGFLTLSAVGGTNSKIDYVDAVPTVSAADTTKPTLSVDLAGTLNAAATAYLGDVTASVVADDQGGSGLASTTYVLDAGASTPVAGTITISGVGDHTLTVTATDGADNVTTVVRQFTIVAPPVDTTPPTVSLDLSGTTGPDGYVGDVTATATAADEDGGSGLASTTYVLDGSASIPYTAPVVVSAGGHHTMTVTATDGSGNHASATQTWDSVMVDVTPPSVSIVLSGSLYTPGTYGGDVTASAQVSDSGSGVDTTTYVLDGSNPAPYTGPVVVTGNQDHTFAVTAYDKQGNHVTKTQTWTQVPVDTTKPTASVSLSGSQQGATYIGSVTATLAAADAESGLASATYVLDGAAAKTVTAAPVVVSAAGNHTLTLTATDNAGNVATAAKSWTSQLVDTVNPTVSVSLAGALYSGSKYGGNVTVTITAADNAGGSGIASTSYVLDGATVDYAGPFVVATTGNHTLAVTTTDNQGNQGTASASWSQQTPDTTKPAASASLAGTQGSGGIYTSDVTVTVTSADEVGGSGLKSTTYSLDGGAATAYTVPVVVTASGSHTLVVTATDNAGNVGTATTAWNQGTAGGSSKLVVTSPDDTVLANPSTPRLVFSAIRGFGPTPAKAFTFTNNGTGTLLISNIEIGGTNANNWKLDVGQATSLAIAPGGTATVSLLFTPTDPTGCSSTTSPTAIGDVVRNATLTFATNDTTAPTGSALLSGVNSCYVGGNNEPVLDQLLPTLGFTDVVDTQYIDRRYIGPLRYLQNTDEIQSPYFTAADSSQPVSLTPIAHYGGPNTNPYQATGWYAQGSTMAAQSVCSSACKTLWQFPADPSSTTYNQNQKLLPTTTTGVTTFNPTGVFGLFSGGGTDVNFSDDGLNTAHTTSNVNMPVPHYLHDMRIYPAYGPGHVAIPNTYIVGVDLSRVPSYKNNDYQDVILLMRNVKPAVSQATVLSASNDIANLKAGGTVSPSCAVTGFDGVMANTAGTQCNAANIAFTSAGLALTSTSGQLANSNQQNALYKTFDATRGAFTIDAQVVGPIDQLTTNYQQIGAFFGPDQSNFLKVEAEHNGTGDPHLTMFHDVKGVSATVASVAVPAITTATTLDLIIKGNTNVPDPLPYGDTYGVHGFPLDELTVYYSIDGGTPVQIGSTTEFPADVTGWFSRSAKAGILDSNTGTTTAITATFSKFAVTAP